MTHTHTFVIKEIKRRKLRPNPTLWIIIHFLLQIKKLSKVNVLQKNNINPSFKVSQSFFHSFVHLLPPVPLQGVGELQLMPGVSGPSPVHHQAWKCLVIIPNSNLQRSSLFVKDFHPWGRLLISCFDWGELDEKTFNSPSMSARSSVIIEPDSQASM